MNAAQNRQLLSNMTPVCREKIFSPHPPTLHKVYLPQL
jgi:hypothetical protein